MISLEFEIPKKKLNAREEISGDREGVETSGEGGGHSRKMNQKRRKRLFEGSFFFVLLDLRSLV